MLVKEKLQQLTEIDILLLDIQKHVSKYRKSLQSEPENSYVYSSRLNGELKRKLQTLRFESLEISKKL